jgi:hypothetical protein
MPEAKREDVPTKQEDVPVSAVLPYEMNERLEAWRASSPLQHASRSAAIRAVIEAGLDALAPKVVPTPPRVRQRAKGSQP